MPMGAADRTATGLDCLLLPASGAVMTACPSVIDGSRKGTGSDRRHCFDDDRRIGNDDGHLLGNDRRLVADVPNDLPIDIRHAVSALSRAEGEKNGE